MEGKRRVNVRGIIWREGKILAVKHKDPDGTESSYWAVPGGGLDLLEWVEDGVQREIYEELGVEAEVGKLLFMQQFNSKRHGFREEFELFFEVKDSPAYDAITLETTSHGHHELARVEFVDPKEVLILPKVISTFDFEAALGSAPSLTLVNELISS